MIPLKNFSGLIMFQVNPRNKNTTFKAVSFIENQTRRSEIKCLDGTYLAFIGQNPLSTACDGSIGERPDLVKTVDIYGFFCYKP